MMAAIKPNGKKKWLWNIALLVLLVCSYFAVRSRVVHDDLGSEDGAFAELITHRPPKPDNFFNGRINGQKLYGRYFQHPRVSYELLRAAGWLVQKQLADPVYLNDAVVTPRLRTLCAVFELILWLILAGFVCCSKAFRGKWPWVLLFAAALCPLGIKSSIFLQIDNTAGVIFCGLAAILLMLPAQNIVSAKWTGVTVFLGGVIAGLGKQEWSLALLAAVLMLPLLALFLKLDRPPKTVLSVILLVLLGLVLGNLASYVFDPPDYVKGFEVMGRFSKLTDPALGHWQMSAWLKLTTFRAPFLFVYAALILFFLLAVFTNKKQSLFSFLLFLYGICLLVPYVFSDWSSELRYFAPSLTVLTVACVTVAPMSFSSLQNKTLYFVFLCVGFSTVIFYLRNVVPEKNRYLEQVRNGLLQPAPNTVFFTSSGAVWNKPDIDYVISTVNYESAKKMVKERYGKELIDCTQITLDNPVLPASKDK